MKINLEKTARNYNLVGLLFFIITLIMIYSYGILLKHPGIIPPMFFLLVACVTIVLSYICRYKAKKMREREKFISTGAGKTAHQVKVLLNDDSDDI